MGSAAKSTVPKPVSNALFRDNVARECVADGGETLSADTCSGCGREGEPGSGRARGGSLLMLPRLGAAMGGCALL